MRPLGRVASAAGAVVVLMAGAGCSSNGGNAAAPEVPGDVELDPTLTDPDGPSEMDDAPTVAVEPPDGDLAELEPPGGWSGVPGQDIEWCMTQLGWEVEANEHGGVGWEIDASQEEALEADLEVCDEARGHDDDDYFTEEYAAVDYENRVAVGECLREEGYEISEPPSKEVYIEQTIQQRYTAWDPMLDLPSSQWRAAGEACPGTPPWELLQEAQAG